MNPMNHQWNRIGAISVPSGRISISDSSFFFDSPMVVDVGPGTYEIRALCRRVFWGTTVDRVRVLRGDSEGATLGDCLGHVELHFSQLAVADRALAEMGYSSLDGEGYTAFTSQFSIDVPYKFISFPDGTPMVIFKPGEGDLNPAVFELVGRSGVIGAELVCVEPDAIFSP